MSRPEGFTDPAGRPVDGELIDRFVGAVYDQCGTCEEAQASLLSEDPATTARVIELGYVALTEHLSVQLPEGRRFPVSAAFRDAIRASLAAEDGAAVLHDTCQRMAPPERRAAANTAAGLVVAALRLADLGNGR